MADESRGSFYPSAADLTRMVAHLPAGAQARMLEEVVGAVAESSHREVRRLVFEWYVDARATTAPGFTEALRGTFRDVTAEDLLSR